MALFEAVASGSLPGSEKWVNVFHFTDDSLPAVASTEISTMLQTFYQGLASELSSGWTLNDIAVRDKATREVRNFPQLISGTNNLSNLPNEVSLVISWLTPVRSRRTRGRTYLAGFTEAQNTGDGANAGRPAVGTIDTVRTRANALIAVTQPARLVVYSRANLSSAEVFGGYINNEWDTQRRRARSIAVTKSVFPQ